MDGSGRHQSRWRFLIAALALMVLGGTISLSVAGRSAAEEQHKKAAKKAVTKAKQALPKRLQAGPGNNARKITTGKATATNTNGSPKESGFRRRLNGNPKAANFNSKGGLPKGLNTTRFGAKGLPKGLNAKGVNRAFGARGLNTRLGRLNPRLRTTTLGRQRLRADHRRELLAVRRLLSVRPLPGQRGFTGIPPAAERRFRTTEMMFQVGGNVSRQAVEAAAARHGLTVVASQSSAITGGTLYHFSFSDGRAMTDAVRALENDRIGVAQPNYVYQLLQESEPAGRARPGTSEQYVIDKLQLAAVHKLATGSNVTIAVIDSQIDAQHPDIAGAVVDQFDAVGRAEKPHVHGTGMAGAISAHLKLIGIAPGAKILAVHAFGTEARQSAEATTQNILAGLDWAIAKGARVINMSFAGPYDPMLALALKNAHDKGVVLIGAVGNAGPKSPPLYPAADPNVIAVTATDENDKLFDHANQGPQVAIAAPGVDIVAPAPGNTYQITTGTSVAAAHVSGVAALLIERHPEIDAATILEVLTVSARKVGDKDRDDRYGWGLIDPESAIAELDARVADSKVATGPANPGAKSTAKPKAKSTAKSAAPTPASYSAR